MQDTQSYFPEILTAFLGAAVTWIGRWLFDRHKERNEVQRSEVELSEKIATMWRENSQELEAKIKVLRGEMDTILSDMDKLKEENRSLKSENKNLKGQVDRLTKRVKEFETNHG